MSLKSNILILTQWSYRDPLIQTYTLPYVKIIRSCIGTERKIILVTAEKDHLALDNEEISNVNKEWKKTNLRLETIRYHKFGAKKILSFIFQFWFLYRLIRAEKILILHAFCMPAGSIAYILSSITGTKLVMDSYEPHATAMQEAGAWKRNGLAFRILFYLEKKLSRKAEYIIGTTTGMLEYALKTYKVKIKKFFVKPACIDFNHFYPRNKDREILNQLGWENKLVIVMAGKIGGIYLGKEIFQIVKASCEFWGDRFRFLLLTSHSENEVNQLVANAGVSKEVVKIRYVSHQDMPRYLSVGDFAINPQVPVPSKRYGTPIKNGEYWGMGLPVIISPGVSDDSDIIIRHNIGAVYDLRNPENHLPALQRIQELLQNESREQLQQRIFTIAKQYRSFDIARNIYPQIYES